MPQEIDGEELAAELFRAYLHQIIIDGFFHADPHPGNVFLTDDGRIALLDLGMVSRLSPARQDQLLKMLLAVSEADGDHAAELALQIGQARGDVDTAALRRDGPGIWCRTVRDVAPRATCRSDAWCSRSPAWRGSIGVRLPSELTLLGKTLLNLDQVGRTLAPDFDVNGALREEAAALMQQRMRKSVSASNVFAAALEAKEFVEHLPARVNKVLDAVANDDLKVKVEVARPGCR